MWWKNKLTLVGFVAGLIAVGVFSGVFSSPQSDIGLSVYAQECNDSTDSHASRIDCWMLLIENEFSNTGTAGAFDVFTYIYQNYESFANSGCHKHAHRVGDLAFYYDYLTHEDLTKVEFPKGATACGYGFYHGFVEHLVQNTPSPQYVDEICPLLKETISNEAPGISQTCFHGAGHGFLLAQSDQLTDPKDWTIDNFITEPLLKCDGLLLASDFERKECYQGVFTVLTEWMADEEYGLTYNKIEPYAHCDRVANSEYQEGCYAEVSQKFDSVSEFSMTKMRKLLESGATQDFYNKTLWIALSGFMQNDPDTDGIDFFKECSEVFFDRSDTCIDVVVGGVIEHGPSGNQYQYVNAFCELDLLTEKEQEYCNRSFAQKLPRYETEEDIKLLCNNNVIHPATCALQETK